MKKAKDQEEYEEVAQEFTDFASKMRERVIQERRGVWGSLSIFGGNKRNGDLSREDELVEAVHSGSLMKVIAMCLTGTDPETCLVDESPVFFSLFKHVLREDEMSNSVRVGDPEDTGRKRNRKMLAALLKYGQHVDCLCPMEDLCPLHLAAKVGNAKVCQWLLEKGAQVDLPSGPGHQSKTAVMWAALDGHVEALAVLLAHDARIDAVDHNHDSALMLAASMGQTHVALFLLRVGAIRTTRNKDRNATAAQIAEELKFKGTAQVSHRSLFPIHPLSHLDYSLTHSLTHSRTHSLTHPPTHSLTHPHTD